MELTQSDSAYVFNCISQHSAVTEEALNEVQDFLGKHPQAAESLIPKIELMIRDLEQGTKLMRLFHKPLKETDDYEKVHDALIARKKWIVDLRQCFDEMKRCVEDLDDE